MHLIRRLSSPAVHRRQALAKTAELSSRIPWGWPVIRVINHGVCYQFVFTERTQKYYYDGNMSGWHDPDACNGGVTYAAGSPAELTELVTFLYSTVKRRKEMACRTTTTTTTTAR